MIGLIQRVTQADVKVNGEIIGAIDRGLLVLLGLLGLVSVQVLEVESAL